MSQLPRPLDQRAGWPTPPRPERPASRYVPFYRATAARAITGGLPQQESVNVAALARPFLILRTKRRDRFVDMSRRKASLVTRCGRAELFVRAVVSTSRSVARNATIRRNTDQVIRTYRDGVVDHTIVETILETRDGLDANIRAFAESCVLVVKVVGANRSGHVFDQGFPQSHSRLGGNGLRVGMLWAVEQHLVVSPFVVHDDCRRLHNLILRAIHQVARNGSPLDAVPRSASSYESFYAVAAKRLCGRAALSARE